LEFDLNQMPEDLGWSSCEKRCLQV
jgi:hypothetical protein